MATLFPVAFEKRYAQYPRRYLNEYHVDGRRKRPDAKGSCATLASARAHAVRAIDQGFVVAVRIFDRRIGQYVFTFRASERGILRDKGYVK